MSVFDYCTEQFSELKEKIFEKEEGDDSPLNYLTGVIEKISIFAIIEAILFGGIYKILRVQTALTPVKINGNTVAVVVANHNSLFMGFRDAIVSHPSNFILLGMGFLGTAFFVARLSIIVRGWLQRYKVMALLGILTALHGTYHGLFSNVNDNPWEFAKFFLLSFIGKE